MLTKTSDWSQRFRRGSGDGMHEGRSSATRETQVGGGYPTRIPRGKAGLIWEAERLVVPRKLGNAGGGKGPQFKGMSKEARARRLV